MIHLYIHIIDRYIIYLLYRLITKRTRLPHRLVKVCDILHLQGGDPAVRDSLQTKILWYIIYIIIIYIKYQAYQTKMVIFGYLNCISVSPWQIQVIDIAETFAETVGCFCRPWLCHHWSARHQRHTSSKATLCPDLHFRPRFGSAPCVLLTPSWLQVIQVAISQQGMEACWLCVNGLAHQNGHLHGEHMGKRR